MVDVLTIEASWIYLSLRSYPDAQFLFGRVASWNVAMPIRCFIFNELVIMFLPVVTNRPHKINTFQFLDAIFCQTDAGVRISFGNLLLDLLILHSLNA